MAMAAVLPVGGVVRPHLPLRRSRHTDLDIPAAAFVVSLQSAHVVGERLRGSPCGPSAYSYGEPPDPPVTTALIEILCKLETR
jgi:hypothetical protein